MGDLSDGNQGLPQEPDCFCYLEESKGGLSVRDNFVRDNIDEFGGWVVEFLGRMKSDRYSEELYSQVENLKCVRSKVEFFVLVDKIEKTLKSAVLDDIRGDKIGRFGKVAIISKEVRDNLDRLQELVRRKRC